MGPLVTGRGKHWRGNCGHYCISYYLDKKYRHEDTAVLSLQLTKLWWVAMDATAELVRKSVSKHQIQPKYGDEQVDTGQDCRNRLARPNSQARTGTRKYLFILFS